MSTEHGDVHHHQHHHRRGQGVKRAEVLIQVAMVVAVAVLAIWLVYGFVSTGGTAVPSYMR